MKNIAVIIVIALLLGVMAWYFLNKKDLKASTALDDKDPSKEDSAASEINSAIVDSGKIVVSDDNGNSIISDSTSLSPEYTNPIETITVNLLDLPTLGSLRAKNWASSTYKGSMDPDDLYEQNRVVSFLPVSNPSALMTRNMEDLSVKLCTTQSSCNTVSISKSEFPFKIVYPDTPEFVGYLSKDSNLIYVLRGDQIVKVLNESSSVQVSQGEAVVENPLPDLSLLALKGWTVDYSFLADNYGSIGRMGKNWNVFKGEFGEAKVSYNNKNGWTPSFATKYNTNVIYTGPYYIDKESFPFRIDYPGSSAKDLFTSFISKDLKTVILVTNTETGSHDQIIKVLKSA